MPRGKARLERCALMYATFSGYEGLSYKATARVQAVRKRDQYKDQIASNPEHEASGYQTSRTAIDTSCLALLEGFMLCRVVHASTSCM